MSEPRLDELVSELAATRPVLDDVARARVGAVIQAACRAHDAARPRTLRRRWVIGAAVAAAAAAVLVAVFAIRDRTRHQLVAVAPIEPVPIGELLDGALLSAPQGATVHGRIHGASLTLYGPGWAARRADKIVVDADAFVVDRSAGAPPIAGPGSGSTPGSSTPGSSADDAIAGDAPGNGPAAGAPLELQLRTATIHVQFATFSVYESHGLQVTVLRGEIFLACHGAADRKVTAGRSATCVSVQTAAASPPAGAPGGDAAPGLAAPAASDPPPQEPLATGSASQDLPPGAPPQAPLSADSPAGPIAPASPPTGSPTRSSPDRVAAASPATRSSPDRVAPAGQLRATTPGATPRPASRPAASVAERAAGSPAATSHPTSGRAARAADRAGSAGPVTVDDVSQFPFAADGEAASSAPGAHGAAAAAAVTPAPATDARIATAAPPAELAAPGPRAAPPSATPAERYAAAERLIAGDARAARTALRALVAEAPEAPEAAPALLDLARLAAAAGDEVAANAALAQLRAHPAAAALAMPAAYLRCTLERTGDGYRTCLAAFRATFPDSPRDAEVLAGLAIATARAGDCAAALPLLDESMRRYPKGPSAADVRAWRAHCGAGK